MGVCLGFVYGLFRVRLRFTKDLFKVFFWFVWGVFRGDSGFTRVCLGFIEGLSSVF